MLHLDSDEPASLVVARCTCARLADAIGCCVKRRKEPLERLAEVSLDGAPHDRQTASRVRGPAARAASLVYSAGSMCAMADIA
jgi:hypothetical protein